MAEEILVKEPLRAELVDAGRKLTHLLAQTDLQLRWSFWLYTSEANEWRLILATPLVDTEGPKHVYAMIRKIVGRSGEPSLALLNMSVQGVQNPYVQAFEMDKYIQGDLEADSVEIRFSRRRVGNLFVEDAILYRIPRRVR